MQLSNEGRTSRHYHVRFESNQLPCELGKLFDRALGEADLDENRFPFDVAELSESCLNAATKGVIVT